MSRAVVGTGSAIGDHVRARRRLPTDGVDRAREDDAGAHDATATASPDRCYYHYDNRRDRTATACDHYRRHGSRATTATADAAAGSA